VQIYLIILGEIFQFRHDLSHKFIIDLCVIYHLLIPSIYPKNVTTMFWLNTYHLQICRCLHASVNVRLIFYVLPRKYCWNFFDKKKRIRPFFEIYFLQWSGWKFSTHVLNQFNSIALPKIKLETTWIKNCHQNQTNSTMDL